MVMISHASYLVSGDNNPASISRFWITNVLTKRIGYRGLILSDDLEMGGILTQTTIEDAAIAAIAAGTHLLEICKDPALVIRAYEALLSEAEKSSAFRRIVEAAFRKIVRAKQAFAIAPPGKPPTQAQIEKLRAQISAFSRKCPAPEMKGSN